MQDLISYLRDKHDESLRSAGRPAPDDLLPGFLDFARAHLRANPPTGVRYEYGGIALTLQDGATVALAPELPTAAPVRGGPTGPAVPVTRGASGAAGTAVPPDAMGPAFPVTGK